MNCGVYGLASQGFSAPVTVPSGYTGTAGCLAVNQPTGRGVAGSAGQAAMPGYASRVGVQGTAFDAQAGNVTIGLLGEANTVLINGVPDGSHWAVFSNGEQFSTSQATWVPSDARLKKNVEPLTGALEAIRKLEPKTYHFDLGAHENMNLPGGPIIGLILRKWRRCYLA
ncbi:MAG: tail fiber domain-containing protein [Flavobacteriales bacterium]|nr:tail fiber domain-containing protein [Flavobacteriales bacterium]